MPGLLAICSERPAYGYWDRRAVWGTTQEIFVPSKPFIITKKLTLPEAALVGAAAAVIKNPVITRRFWAGWTL